MTEWKTCRNCGKKVDKTSDYCPYCGLSVFEGQEIVQKRHEGGLLEKFFYWQDDGTGLYALAKSKLIGVITFITFFLSFIYSPTPLWAGIFVSLVFSLIAMHISLAGHKLTHTNYTIRYPSLYDDLKNLFFYWNNNGEYTLSKTKIISAAVFVVMGLWIALTTNFLSVIFVMSGLIFEIPVFIIGYAIHKITGNRQIPEAKKPKEVKASPQVKEKNNVVKEEVKPKVDLGSIPEFEEFKKEANLMSEDYARKEAHVKDLIEQRFTPPQITYTKFITYVDKCSEVFYKQVDAINTITSLASEDSQRIDDELKHRIGILNTITDKIEDLINELVLNLSKSDEEELDFVLEDMETLIDSVHDYK